MNHTFILPFFFFEDNEKEVLHISHAHKWKINVTFRKSPFWNGGAGQWSLVDSKTIRLKVDGKLY